MTNEEIIEELYWAAHRANVFEDFRKEVSQLMKQNPSMEMVDAVEDVYRKYRKSELIPTGRNVNHNQVLESLR